MQFFILILGDDHDHSWSILIHKLEIPFSTNLNRRHLSWSNGLLSRWAFRGCLWRSQHFETSKSRGENGAKNPEASISIGKMFQSPRDFSIEIGWNRDIPQSLTFHGWSSAFCWPGKAYFEISNETMKFVFPEPGPLEGVKSRSKVILRRWAEGWMGFRKIFFVLLLWPKLLLFYILLLRLQKITKIIWKFMPVLKAFFVLKLQRAGSTVEFELRRDNLTAFSCGVLQSKHRFQDPTKTRCCYLRSPQPQSPKPRA